MGNKIFKLAMLMAIIYIVATVSGFIYIYTSNKLEYRKSHRYMELEYSVDWENYTREEVRADLEKLFGAKFYIYKEEDLDKKGVYGLTTPLIRLIRMDDNISIELYTFYFAHELVHLTHFTASEKYCNLVAFKVLYNTEKYRDIAIRYAIQDRNGCITQDYSCWEYIFDYLMEENKWMF